jgi:hypothetical protein
LFFRQQEVPRKALQHVLPGPDRAGVPQGYGLSRLYRPDAVGDDPVLRVIAPADNVPRAGSGNSGGAGTGKKRTEVTDGYQVAAGLAV